MQVVSRELRMPMSNIHLRGTSTETVPNTNSSGGSVVADVNGLAVKVKVTAVAPRPSAPPGQTHGRSSEGTELSSSSYLLLTPSWWKPAFPRCRTSSCREYGCVDLDMNLLPGPLQGSVSVLEFHCLSLRLQVDRASFPQNTSDLPCLKTAVGALPAVCVLRPETPHPRMSVFKTGSHFNPDHPHPPGNLPHHLLKGQSPPLCPVGLLNKPLQWHMSYGFEISVCLKLW